MTIPRIFTAEATVLDFLNTGDLQVVGTAVKIYEATGVWGKIADTGTFEVDSDKVNFYQRLLCGTSTTVRASYATAVDVAQFFTSCLATSGICTGLDFEHAAGYQGATSLQFTGIRGVLRVLSGTTHTAGYNDACAGYLKMEGVINGSGHYYGVRGVVLDGGTWTACTEVAAGCFEYNNSQTITAGLTAILLLKNNSSPPATVTDLIYVYNGQPITYALEFSTVGTAPVTTGTDSVNVTHKIAVKVGSASGYLHVFSD